MARIVSDRNPGVRLSFYVLKPRGYKNIFCREDALTPTMARCKQTTRNAYEGGKSPRKTIRLPTRPAADDVSAEAKQQEEGTKIKLLPGYTSSDTEYSSDFDNENSSSRKDGGGSETTVSPQYRPLPESSSPSSSDCGKTIASEQDDWSVASSDIQVSTSPAGHAGHAQKSVIATEPGGNRSPPSDGPYYIHLSGSGFVEIRVVPQDRLVWEEESGEETEDATGRKIEVTGETKLECQVTQQVYHANGEHTERNWTRTLGGMCNWWWWACTIAYRCLRCV